MNAHAVRARPIAALASAAVTGLAVTLLLSVWSPADAQPKPDPWDGSAFINPTDGATSATGTFAGTFRHTPPAPIASIQFEIAFSAADTHPPGCAPAPPPQAIVFDNSTTTSTSLDPSTSATPTTNTPSGSSSKDFSFDVQFTCNGIYDASATARLEDQSNRTPPPLEHTITATSVKVAVPPKIPTSLVATDNGNNTVALSWAPPAEYAAPQGPPPDFQGYRLSRKDANSSAFAVIGSTTPDVLTFTDTSIPAGGGSFFYQVESARKFAVSAPLITSGPLNVGGTAGGGTTSGGSSGGGGRPTGGSGGSANPGSGGTGTAHYDDTTTLAADEAEPGDAGPFGAVPGGGVIQRFGAGPGAGLVKPFAAALDLGVWAGLLLFLTRRAAKAERAAVSAVELENAL